MNTVLKRILSAFSVVAVSAVLLPEAASAAACNPAKALTLLRQGQQQSVDGDKAKAVATQFQAAREAWTC